MDQLSFTETEPQKAIGFVFGATCAVITACLLSLGPALGYLLRGPAGFNDWSDWVQVATASSLWAITLIWAFQWVSWNRNRDRFRYRVSADEDGLTYANDHKAWRWSWNDLSPFEHRRATLLRAEHIRFHPKSFHWKENWWNGLDLAAAAARRNGYAKGQWEFYLLDGFDLPLPALAERLNAYREQALATNEPDADPER